MSRKLDNLFKKGMNLKDSELVDEFEGLPAGEYVAEVVDVVIKESKTGKQMFLWKYKVIEGDFEGRLHWNPVMLEDNDGNLKANAMAAQSRLVYQLLGEEQTEDSDFDELKDYMEQLGTDCEDGDGAQVVLTLTSYKAKSGATGTNTAVEIYE